MKKTLLIVVATFSSTAWAADPFGGFDPNQIVTGSNVTGSELGVIANTIASDLKFRPVEGARAKGPWTLSIGLLAGAMPSGKLQEAFPNNQVPPVVPTADIVGVVQVTRDFAAEFGFLPSLNLAGNKFSKFGLGIKWTASNVFFEGHPPFALAFRANYTKPSLTLVSGTAEAAYEGSMIGFNATMGFGGGGFEPYVGLGYTSVSATMNGTGSADFFGTPVSFTQAVPVSTSSVEFFGGFALQGGPVGLALQAEYGFGNLMGVLKLSLQIGPFGDSEPKTDQRVARRRPPPPATRAPAAQPQQPQQRPGQPAKQGTKTQQRQQPTKQQRPEEAPPPPGY